MDKQLIKDCVSLYQDGSSRMDVARHIQDETGLKGTAAKVRAKWIWDTHFNKEYVSPENKDTKESVKFQENGSSATAESKSSNIKTLDDLIRVCEIDTDVWAVKNYIANKWEVAAKDNKGELKHAPLFQIKAWLERKAPISAKDMTEKFLEATKNYAPKSFSYPKKKNDSGNLFMIALVDHHLGKTCLKSETGKEYDIEVSKKDFNDAIDSLISRVNEEGIEKVLFVIGNDYFNIDNINRTTTAGTPQLQSSGWAEMFMEGCNLAVENIEKIAAFWPVDVLVQVGNHDKHSSFTLGEYLKAFFRKNENINILNDPLPRKYYSWGTNLLGFTHGNTGKLTDLPMVMLTDQASKRDAAFASHKHFFVGHFHHQNIKESMGVKVEILPSLTEVDLWHSEHNFIGNIRCSKAFVFNSEEGQIANYYYNIK